MIRTAWALVCLALLLTRGGTTMGQERERMDFSEEVGKAGKGSVQFDDDVVSGSPATPALGSEPMRRANQLAASILESRMKRERPDDLKLVRAAAAADIVVVRGVYDRVQDVLKGVKVKHVVIPPELLERVPLMSLQTVMVNCPGHLGRAAIAKLRRFVKTGGYLVTTDWALGALQTMFPGTVARGGRNTQNDVVQVHVHEGSDPLLGHVLNGKSKPRWWLEAGSYPIEVKDRAKVQVLVSSPEMGKRYGHSPVVIAFRHDDGRVLHMTSHFYLQQAKLIDAREKARGSEFAAAVGLDAKTVAGLKREGLDRASAGELNSAYSMQQVTTNVLVAKAKENRALLRRFTVRARQAFDFDAQPGPALTVERGQRVGEGYVLRVKGRRGRKVQVVDLFGREGWTDEKNLEPRDAK